jgi:LacI family transcriptional regulator
VSTRAPRIGVFLRLDAYHSHGILRGVAQFAREHPAIEVLKLPQPPRFRRAALRELRLDAVVARVTTRADETELLHSGLPAVNISGEAETLRIGWVNTDDRAVGVMAHRHLTQRGLRHFAYCGNRTHRASLLRRESFAAAICATGGTFATYDLERQDEATPFPLPVRRSLARWLRRLPHPIGILCFNDRVALEVAAACELARLRLPDDVALVGVGNDLTRLEFSRVDITSIELPTFQLGYAAMQAAYRAFRKMPAAPPHLLLAPLKIVTRRSTERFAVDDEAVAVALDHIREHLANTIYVSDVARAAGVSRRVLEKRCRLALGKSVYATVQELRLGRAEELMSDPRLSLTEIAYAAGYENLRHMCLAFRRTHGTTPSGFRSRYQRDGQASRSGPRH